MKLNSASYFEVYFNYFNKSVNVDALVNFKYENYQAERLELSPVAMLGWEPAEKLHLQGVGGGG
jgi:hypothetical protein